MVFGRASKKGHRVSGMSGVGKASGGFAGRLISAKRRDQSSNTSPTTNVPNGLKKEIKGGQNPSCNSAADQAKSAARAVLEGKKPREVEPMTGPEMTVAVTDIIRESPTGSRILEEFEASGLSIEFGDSGDAAGYYDAENGKLVISDAYLSDDPHDVVGVVMHELGHFIVDSDDDLEASLNDFPDGTGHLADEVIAEAFAVQVTSELGIGRANTAMSDSTGSPRTFAEGMQYMLDNEFYVDYYDIDLGDISSEEQAEIMHGVAALGFDTVSQYASDPLPAFGQGAPDESPGDFGDSGDSTLDNVDQILDSGLLGAGGSIVGGFL